ncbi:MAG: glycosyltransferase family 4 protein [Kofleriaceae bacterium]|nr:glycosyltransferase family 4 protein [Kofleriaceae bacterium]
MTADTVGGVWTYTCELVRALAPFGVDVTIATMGREPTTAQRREADALPNARLVSSEFALEWMRDPWRDVDSAGEWLCGVARHLQPDIVHVNGYAHAGLRFDAPVVCVAHSCVCSWHRAVRGQAAPAEWNEYRRRVTMGLFSADRVVAPTHALARMVKAEYGAELDIRVIANGRDPDLWTTGPKEPFVLSAGRLWDEAKGLQMLDAAAARVSWPIYVAGPTEGPRGFDCISTGGVAMLGELDRESLAGWMSRAAIYALPARYEPFGLSVVEAALSGCALVLGRIDSLHEVWGDCAVYVRTDEPDALAAALDTLAQDPLRRRTLAAAARARALQLTPARMATSYHALYTELLGAATEVA